MKKLALFAMLLGSSFLYGCGEASTKKEPPKPDATATEGDKKTEEGTKADETKPPEGEKKTEEAPK
ncbi:MAG: hypothetical protein IT426_10480 [Pirellulales bacterium]|nr:hypothetical protein [Pirellulales bacterium]